MPEASSSPVRLSTFRHQADLTHDVGEVEVVVRHGDLAVAHLHDHRGRIDRLLAGRRGSGRWRAERGGLGAEPGRLGRDRVTARDYEGVRATGADELLQTLIATVAGNPGLRIREDRRQGDS